jgi:hypothetical protein
VTSYNHPVLGTESFLSVILYPLTKLLQTLSVASREVGVEVNTEKTKNVVTSHHQNVGQNHSFLIANKSFKSVAKFRYFVMTVTNQNCFHEEIKSRLSFGNASYYPVQNFLSSYLLSKNLILCTKL